jgi:hypothetical protein
VNIEADENAAFSINFMTALPGNNIPPLTYPRPGKGPQRVFFQKHTECQAEENGKISLPTRHISPPIQKMRTFRHSTVSAHLKSAGWAGKGQICPPPDSGDMHHCSALDRQQQPVHHVLVVDQASRPARNSLALRMTAPSVPVPKKQSDGPGKKKIFDFITAS